ncbi:SMC-Scp complex subunit ScpB [Bifidobacterium simiarum]|uniref:SMC-Scp complex subunit ScpB n=1 Tax=Bifidobacterium simiarum TaxID=2045441 RepID=UPI001F0A530F|nr:SMC-Scp complex subunit ScpB [Bifidobacterium simiarum]
MAYFDVDEFPGGLKACLEAVLMAADRPYAAADFARVLGMDDAAVERALEDLRADYDGVGGGLGAGGDGVGAESGAAVPRGFELRHTVRGWRLATRAAFEPVVAAFVSDGKVSRLSQAALETMAIIAYQQPVTRGRVAAIRGVNSDGVIRSLLVRGLVAERGADEETGAALLVTTDLFLEHMGFDDLGQLPALTPFLPESAQDVRPTE